MADLGSDDSEGFTGPQPGKCPMDLDSQTAEVPSLEPEGHCGLDIRTVAS